MESINSKYTPGHFLKKALKKSESGLKSQPDASRDDFFERYKHSLQSKNSRPKSQNSSSGLNLRPVLRSGNEHTVIRYTHNNKDGILQPLNEKSGLLQLNGPQCKETEIDCTKYCVCANCGSFSQDFHTCDRCDKLLPPNSKMYRKAGRNCDGNIVTSSTDASKFYSSKIKDQVYQRNYPMKQVQPAAKRLNDEPVCLTISSDEEEQKSIDTVTSPEIKSSVPVIRYPQNNYPVKRTRIFAETPSNIPISNVNLKCRSIRIGSFRYVPDLPVIMSNNEILFHASLVNGKCNISILLRLEDIVEVRYHIGSEMPVFFIETTPSCASGICTKLNMHEDSDVYFNPAAIIETQKRITILPEKVANDQKIALLAIFRSFKKEIKTNDISYPEANKILVQSTPQETAVAPAVSSTNGKNYYQMEFKSPAVTKMMTYPPPPQTGGITITTEDYSCLEEGEFLNDVIIDFYLKYLVQNKLSEADRQRTHIFSSFFWRRLTQRANRRTSTSEEPKLPPAEQRHNRVKTWTRHLDIFKKDFIIIPINEHLHWFLAVICFSTLDAPQPLSEYKTNSSSNENNSESPRPPDQIEDEKESRDWIPNIDEESLMEDDEENSSSTNPLNNGLQVEEDGSNVSTPNANPPIVQPCILIFDSLLRGNHGRIVSTLREYLRLEWSVKNGNVRTFEKERVKGSVPKVPHQDNNSDCGIYLLQYVESFFEDPIKDFSIPISNLQNWFSKDIVNNKRTEIQQLILQLKIQEENSSGS